MEANGSKYAPLPGSIPGTELNLGGQKFIAAPLNLDGLQVAIPILKELDGQKDILQIINQSAKVLHLSLIRNNPDITLEEVAALLDAGNVVPAMYSVCGISGLEFAKSGESRPSSQ